MTDDRTDERKAIYKDYRTGKRNLKKARDFADWMKVMRGYDQARREAMHLARTNKPVGAAYRKHFAEIDRREKLIDRDEHGREFPSKEDRTYCIYVLENYDVPSYDSRRPSLKMWRDGLSHGERARLNHPKRVWLRYWSDTEPLVDKDARRVEHRVRLRLREGERGDAQRREERMRELLGRVLDEIEDMPLDLRDAIARALAS